MSDVSIEDLGDFSFKHILFSQSRRGKRKQLLVDVHPIHDFRMYEVVFGKEITKFTKLDRAIEEYNKL